MPSYGCQVIVQSEDEKQLRKQVRKEEKKVQKLLKTRQDQDSDEDEFDPKELVLRSQQVALSSAMTKPLIKPKERSPIPTVEKYPFVFDIYAEAKMSAGFIQGTKMVLPKGFERTDNKKAEEVYIPASEKAPVNVGKDLVPISSLDYIGQQVNKPLIIIIRVIPCRNLKNYTNLYSGSIKD